mmetsp:Transcript_17189/g.34432  ORF Transcript_17189/g.34432 Transcript_17189/m.34432 type:complete len:700 (-) Transcript_17189:10-2109(-)
MEKSLNTKNAFIVFSFTTSLFTLILSMVWEHLRDPVLSWITSRLPEAVPQQTVEALIVAPAVIIIPLTHVIGSVRYTHQKWISKPLQGGLTHIILQAVTWSLYSIALIVLGIAVFWRPGIFGLLSSAALLGLFAQGLMVTSILTFERDSDSKMRNRYNSDSELEDDANDEYDTSKMKVVTADAWAQSPVKRKRRSSAYVEHKQRKRKRDLLLWALMNYGLLQTPYFLHWFYKTVVYTCVDCVSGDKSIRDIPAFFTLIATLGIPFFTHGIGGILFHGRKWSFHHPFAGGGIHVMSQAAGWTLVGLAALMQLANIVFGTSFDFLLHSGNVLGWVAEGLLLYSLLNFKEGAGGVTVEDIGGGKHRNALEFAFSIGQDMFMTNMHWCFVLWFASAPFGFNLFSLNPMENLFKVTALEGGLNFLLVLFLCTLPSLFFPYSAARKPLDWKHPVSCLVKLAEVILVSPFGLFRDSKIVFEEDEEVYKKSSCMFAIAPHGTLPLSVWALWHQRCDIFDSVCLFFGSQVGIVPGYRLWTGARGGCMTITKKNLISVMKTDNNVALVPGGVSEMMKCEPHGKNINVSIKHKGFVRIAIQEGFDLVPILMLHENDMYNNPLRDFQLWCYKRFKVPVGLPYYTNKWFLPMSNQKPLRVVVGKRIKVKKQENPTEEQVEATHRLFYEEVVRCWGKWKKPMGYEERELTFVM